MQLLSYLIGLFRGDGWGATGQSGFIPQPSTISISHQSESSPKTPPVQVSGLGGEKLSGSSAKSRFSRIPRPSPQSSPTPSSYSLRGRGLSLIHSRRRRTLPAPPQQQQQQDAHASPRVPRGTPTPPPCPLFSLLPAPVKIMPPAAGTRPPKGEYIETDTGNKVARKAQLHGTQHIILGGRAVIQPQVCIRGDLVRNLPLPSPSAPGLLESNAAARAQQQQQNTVAVAIGRYSFISSGSVLRPPYKLHRGKTSYHPLKIGEHVFVGPNCVIEAASIGDRVHIGTGSVLGRFAILKEGCRVLEGTVVPGGMVVPSGCVIGGRPGRVLGDVGDGYGFGEMGGDLRELWRRTG